MGAYLSLPVLGYFMMPSTSTSINLIFFYITWMTLVLSHDPLRVEIVGTMAIRLLLFFIPSLFFLLFDSIIPSVAARVKLQGGDGLSVNKPQWYRVAGLSLFNLCLGVAIQAGIALACTSLKIAPTFKVAVKVPMPWSIGTEVLRSLVLREVVHYYTHRFILHAERPNFLSRQHKAYFHAIRAPYSFCAYYDHPLPYLVGRFLPTYLPAVVFRDTHLLTFLVYLAVVTVEETLTLSGYNVVPSIMLGGVARRQDLHSMSRGRGNYSPWGLLDWLHGTGLGGDDVVDDLRDEAEKHDLKGRGGRALSQAKETGAEGIKAIGGSVKRRSKRT